MTNRDPLGWRVDPQVREEFREFVADKHGKTHGKLGEELESAMREYMDDTRLARMEQKLDDIQGTLSENSDTHTHDTCKPQSPTAEKVDEIVDLVRTDIKPDEALRTDAIDRAIEEVAGADPRTITRYHRQLKRRGEAYTHPNNEDVWFVDFDTWVGNAYHAIDGTPGLSLGDVLEPYPVDHDDFIDAVERLGLVDEAEVEA